MISKLQRVPLREVWRDEARDFTPWLQDNIDVLNDIIDFSLVTADREQSCGSFSVDIVAEDVNGHTIVIENQLEKSDHDHLGKLITYLVAMDARVGIWINSNPQPEHINAITWLNESSSNEFYLIKVEAVKIDDSCPAPLFTLIVGPSEEGREVGKIKEKRAERYEIRERFWTKLLDKAKTKTNLHSTISPSQYGWIGTTRGMGGLNLNYAVREHSAQVELYIDRGKDSKDENKQIFDLLKENQTEIEKSFGDKLEWQRLDNRRASRIRKEITTGGWKDEEKWPLIHEELIKKMIAFSKAIKPYLKQIKDF